MMGAGKTTVGRIWQQAVKIPFFDTDELRLFELLISQLLRLSEKRKEAFLKLGN
jgi:shikimate kinase